MQDLQRDRQSTSRRWHPILRSRRLRFTLVGIACAAALLYLSPRLGLSRMLTKLLGTDGALLLVIALLVGVVAVGVVAVAYGLSSELSTRRPRHRDLRSH